MRRHIAAVALAICAAAPLQAQPEFVKLYQATFAEAEIRQLIVFYRTPLGQRLIEKQPELTRGTGLVYRRLMAPHMQELQQRMMSRMGVGY